MINEEELENSEEIEYDMNNFFHVPTIMEQLKNDFKDIKHYNREDNIIKMTEYSEINKRLELLKREEATPEIELLIIEAKEMLKKITSDIVEHNISLVISIAKRYQSRQYSLEDLIQDGSIGLMKAIERFDSSMGFSFATYATWWIKQCMLRAKGDTQEIIRIPIHMFESIYKMNVAIKRYEGIHGKEPSDSELRNILKLSEEQLLELKKAACINRSLFILDKPCGDEEDSTTLMEIIADEEDQYAGVDNKDREEFIKNLIDKSIPNERAVYIIKNRLGYNEEKKAKTLEEIGMELNLTRERIRQVEFKSIKRIKNYCKTKKIDLRELF